MNRQSLILIVLVFHSHQGVAASPLQKNLPKTPAAHEIGARYPRRLPVDPAPEGFKTMVPEWAESSAALLNWPMRDFVDAFTQRTRVLTAVDTPADATWWKTWLKEEKISHPERVHFLNIPTNSIWVRDYGPEFIYRHRRIELIDLNYYPSRPLDDQFPMAFSRISRMPVYRTGIVGEGGNIYADAGGRGFASTRLPFMNEAMGDKELRARLSNYLGLRRSLFYPFAPHGEWAHIDTFAKIVSPDTWIVAAFPKHSKYHKAAEEFVAHLQSTSSSIGTPHRIFRSPMVLKPNSTQDPNELFYRAYINSLIHNDFVFLPAYGDAQDEVAVRTYQQALPGYKIIPVLMPSVSWKDAIHCRSKNLPDPDFPYLQPSIFISGPNSEIQIYVNAHVPEGQTFRRFPRLHWKLNQGPWTSVELEDLGDGYFYALKGQPSGTKVSFYVEGSLRNGRSFSSPRFAPKHAYEVVIGSKKRR